MRRRKFITLLGGAAAWPLAAWAQQAGRTYRLGCLFPPPRDSPPNMAFFDELRRRGFIEGQNLTVEYRAYGQHVDLIPQYATELVMARVDVIVTAGDETVRAVQQATKTIPIVALVGDMLGSGLVTSLARPDGNTTGVSILARARAANDAHSRPSGPSHHVQHWTIRRIQSAASSSSGVELSVMNSRDANEIERGLATSDTSQMGYNCGGKRVGGSTSQIDYFAA